LEHVLKHSLFAAFTVTIGAYFYFKGSTMPSSAALFPQIVAGLIFLLSGAMVLQSVRDVKNGTGEPAGDTSARQKVHVPRVILFTLSIAVYIYLIPRIGYFIATPLFMVVSYLYLKAAGFVRAILISLGFSVFIYFLFVWFLKLPIPMGLLERFFEV
jgi:putative tricarboxylic transport membrane protein